MKWYCFEKLLARLHDEGVGRLRYPAAGNVKALLMQAPYALLDAELEARAGRDEAAKRSRRLSRRRAASS